MQYRIFQIWFANLIYKTGRDVWLQNSNLKLCLTDISNEKMQIPLLIAKFIYPSSYLSIKTPITVINKEAYDSSVLISRSSFKSIIAMFNTLKSKKMVTKILKLMRILYSPEKENSFLALLFFVLFTLSWALSDS